MAVFRIFYFLWEKFIYPDCNFIVLTVIVYSVKVSCSTCRQRCESLVYITNIVIYVVMRFDIPEGTSALTHVWEHSSVLFFLEMFKRFLLVMIFLDYGSCQRVYAVPFDC